MPQDLVTYKILANELDQLLKNGKVQKINMPEKDEIRLSLYKDGNFTLVLSCNPQAPRIHICDDKKDNPYTPPTFCMLLRKHLTGATLLGVDIFNNDRIFKLSFLGKTELLDATKYTIYCELMGRYSNIILCDENDKILDSVVHIGFDNITSRVIMPNMTYNPPEKGTKAELFEYEKIEKLLSQNNESDAISQLLKNINGLSKQTANEILYRAKINYPFSQNDVKNIIKIITFFNEIYTNNQLNACTLPDYSDFFVTPYISICNENDYKKYPTLNGSINQCYKLSDKKIRTNNSTKDIQNILKRHHDKLVKKIKIANEKLKECDDMENVRINAELLSSNIYKIKRGDKSVVVENYYDNMNEKVINLDVTKSPSQNATHLYNKYNKLKRAKIIVTQQLENYNTELNYVSSIQEELKRANIDDIFDIKEEMATLNIIKKPQYKKGEKKPRRAEPKSYEVDGYTIVFGTNNVLNNEVTFKIGRSFDMWVHIKNNHGCHLIIKKNNENDTIPDSVLLSACQTCAYYSEARDGQNVPVDYTERKFVRRIKNAGLGMVTYDNFKTLFVNPKDNSTKENN